MTGRAERQTELEKAIASAERMGLMDYDIVKEGRRIILRVRHSQPTGQALNVEEKMKRVANS